MCSELFFLFPYLPQSDIAYKKQCDNIKADILETHFIVGVMLSYFTLLCIK